jgi:hypothetical protein
MWWQKKKDPTWLFLYRNGETGIPAPKGREYQQSDDIVLPKHEIHILALQTTGNDLVQCFTALSEKDGLR